MGYMPVLVANGAAILDAHGKLAFSQLPSIVIVDVFPVSSEAEMLALDADQGDLAVRSDESRSYILKASPAADLSNWQLLPNPSDVVQSINGYTGSITLNKTDLGLGNVDNTPDNGKPVSGPAAIALALKVNTSSLATVATSGSYTDLSNKPSIPTKVSDLSNDSAFVDAAGASSAAPVQSVAGRTGSVTLTRSDVALSNVDNTTDANKPVSSAQAAADASIQSDLNSHKNNTNNPHSTTKAQVGLGNADNTSDTGKPVSTAQATAIGVVQTDLNSHKADVNNPHSTTKSQVGLGSCDNTTDANKPVSTAQAAAILAASYALTSGEASATGDATTSSGTDALLTGMTQTLASGTYLVWFNTSITSPTPGAAISSSIYVGGVQKADSLRKIIPCDGGTLSSGSGRGIMQVVGRVTVNGSQAVELRWSTSSGTATCGPRTMNWLRVA